MSVLKYATRRVAPCYINMNNVALLNQSKFNFSNKKEDLSETQNKENPCFIRTISYEDSEGRLRNLYDRVKGPDNNVDNIMLSHSLRPHTMEGHMHIYKRVLHHTNNTILKWKLEFLGVFVSLLNNCKYCFEHHFQGMKNLLIKENDNNNNEINNKYIDELYDALLEYERNEFEEIDDIQTILENILNNDPEECDKLMAMISYAALLTENPSEIELNDIEILKELGIDDGEILEINQVVSYFNYANRTVLGLGVHSVGDILGLSPSDNNDENNWSHTNAQK